MSDAMGGGEAAGPRGPAMRVARLAFAAMLGVVPATASTFPEMEISRGSSEDEWPFAIERGTLTCVALNKQRFVFFAEILTTEVMGEFGSMTLPRSVVVSANPMSYFATIEHKELYAPWDSLETLIKRLAPYERMGWALCDADEAKSLDNQPKEN